MTISWELVLAGAFAAVGVLEYVKGFFGEVKPKAWRLLQPVLCILFAATAALLPSWVMAGVLSLALSQIGYELIIETVRKKIGGEK
jgi:hypothetical protein